MLTAMLGVGCVHPELRAQDAGPPAAAKEPATFFSLFSFGKKTKSVERLVRTDDGKWHVDGEEDGAIAKARTSYDTAVEHFRQELYGKAGREFHAIAKAYKDTPLEEDALFMEAECYFKLERLPKAQDKYTELMTRYPTTRYMPQAVQRTYDIAFFWLEDSRLRSQGKDAKNYAITNYVNLFDRKRPFLDTEGRALEAIESIQTAEPTGPLSDDALMMAGAHTFTSENFVKAAGYYEQLAIDMPKSEHAQKALVLGAQAYLRGYEGPNYDSTDLENAFKLTTAALKRPDMPDEQRARLEADLRLIYLERAKRDFNSGEQYRRMRRPSGARYYYQLVLKNYPDTDWARRAKEELDRLPPESTTTAATSTGVQQVGLWEKMKARFGGSSATPSAETQPIRVPVSAPGEARPVVPAGETR